MHPRSFGGQKTKLGMHLRYTRGKDPSFGVQLVYTLVQPEDEYLDVGCNMDCTVGSLGDKDLE